jgi:hypothetical protein
MQDKIEKQMAEAKKATAQTLAQIESLLLQAWLDGKSAGLEVAKKIYNS